jgi:DUF1680 family protein
MRLLKTIVLTGFIFFQFQFLYAQELLLDGNWKYSFKDDPGFSSLNAEDINWKEKDGSKLLFTKDDLDINSSITWLRKTIIISSNFKKEADKTGALSIFLGHIFQTDEVYFNGELIGATNSSDIKRIYIINPEHIRWDKKNSIAIRISHWGDVCGLENTSPPFIASAPPVNIFELNSSADNVQRNQQVKDRQIVFNLTIINHSPKTTNADAGVEFYNLEGKKINEYHKKTDLFAGNNIISFPYKSPYSFLKIRYTVTVPGYPSAISWNDEYGYEDIAYKPAMAIVSDKVEPHFAPAEFQQQVIKGWLGERLRDNEENRLYNVDEEAILTGYINRPGNHPWIGEHAGKFLDAAINTYKNTGHPTLKAQIDRTAQQLIAAQLSDGYLGTYIPDNYWTSWDVWSHKYNIIGLLDYYSLSGFEPALNAAKKAADLLCKTFGYNNGQLDIIKAGDHLGMAATSVLEPMVDLYKFTADKKYLDFCYYIIKSYDQDNGPKIISTLDATGRVDKTANAKAYEMLSNLVGLTKLYKLTGEDRFLKPVLLAWNDIVSNRLFITGTTSSSEHFRDNNDLPASDKDDAGEGCVTVTWIQLNYQLLCITAEMKYVNELERSVYNHLTAAENPQSGCVSYFTPLVGVKPYSCVITCCMSSVPRAISMIPLFANGKINNTPSFLFYEPGTYSTIVTGNRKVSFKTVTDFPNGGNVSVYVDIDNPVKFPVEFRKPYWAADFSISINDEKQNTESNDAVTIDRVWKKGDNISVSFTMPLIVLDGGKSYPGQFALQRGPQVLAFDNNINGFNIDSTSVDPKNIILQSALSALPDKWIGQEAFQLKSPTNNSGKNIILVPFADASQTGGTISTWIKNSFSK